MKKTRQSGFSGRSKRGCLLLRSLHVHRAGGGGGVGFHPVFVNFFAALLAQSVRADFDAGECRDQLFFAQDQRCLLGDVFAVLLHPVGKLVRLGGGLVNVLMPQLRELLHDRLQLLVQFLLKIFSIHMRDSIASPVYGVAAGLCRLEITCRKVYSLVVISRVARPKNVHSIRISPSGVTSARVSRFSTTLSVKSVGRNLSAACGAVVEAVSGVVFCMRGEGTRTKSGERSPYIVRSHLSMPE